MISSEAARSEAKARTWRVLIVEDEILLARDTAYMLEDMGCVVVGIAATAENAIELAGSYRPDLVLMDIRLKGPRNGIEAAARIHELFGLPHIFVTAQSDEAILVLARASHPVGFLFKPFAEAELSQALSEAGLPAAFPCH